MRLKIVIVIAVALLLLPLYVLHSKLKYAFQNALGGLIATGLRWWKPQVGARMDSFVTFMYRLATNLTFDEWVQLMIFANVTLLTPLEGMPTTDPIVVKISQLLWSQD